LYIRLILIFIINLVFLKYIYLENRSAEEKISSLEEENRRAEEKISRLEEEIHSVEEENRRRIEEEESNRDLTIFEKIINFFKFTYVFDMILKILILENFSTMTLLIVAPEDYITVVGVFYSYSFIIFLTTYQIRIKKNSILNTSYQIINFRFIIVLALVSFISVNYKRNWMNIDNTDKIIYSPLPLPLILILKPELLKVKRNFNARFRYGARTP
jgi:hypothetical protein